MGNSWLYRNTVVNFLSDLPENVEGFVYLIEHKETGEKYIGKKTFRFKKTRPPLKGKKRRRVTYVESDWRTYTGSSDVTKGWNPEDCIRTILHICYNKTMMTYLEVREQFSRGVLESDEYLNDNILGKFYKKRIKKFIDDSRKN